jgi:hypothetical protein
MSQQLERRPEVYARYFGRLSHRHLEARRKAGEQVSSAHSETHLNGVSSLIPAIGEAYGFSQREVVLGRFAAQFHDIVRTGREDQDKREVTESAMKAHAVLDELERCGTFATTFDEKAAVDFAILNHGRTPTIFRNPDTREVVPSELHDRLHVMLYISDGLQKLGVPLIHRRSAYVGGERLSEGDLKDVTYEGRKIDAVEAIVLESAVRLGWKNAEDDYPERVKPFIQPAFATQREWVTGLLAARRLDVARWADMLWNARDEQGRNVFEIPNLSNAPKSQQEIIDVLNTKGKISDDAIAQAREDGDLMYSSVEAALHFSNRYKGSPRLAIEEWNPRGERAKIWKKGM